VERRVDQDVAHAVAIDVVDRSLRLAEGCQRLRRRLGALPEHAPIAAPEGEHLAEAVAAPRRRSDGNLALPIAVEIAHRREREAEGEKLVAGRQQPPDQRTRSAREDERATLERLRDTRHVRIHARQHERQIVAR
jgi:hypothetical protein